jgi:hypothetical protein
MSRAIGPRTEPVVTSDQRATLSAKSRHAVMGDTGANRQPVDLANRSAADIARAIHLVPGGEQRGRRAKAIL